MATFHFEIVSPEGIVYKDDIDEVLLPTDKGEIGVLPHHIPLFTKLSDGEVRIKKGGKDISIAITGGFLQIDKTTTTVLSDYAIRADSIEIAHAQEAKQRAEKLMKEKLGEQDFAEVSKEFQRALLELKIADKVRKRRVS